jgi:Ser/Thr protein kinase RdoA (MazF antagonist)
VKSSEIEAIARAHGGAGELRPIGERVSRAGELALKLFGDPSRARLEAALLAHLDGADPRYRVQKLVALVDRGEESLLLTRWEPGVFKPYEEISEHEWAQLGTELAALHLRLDEGELPPMESFAERIRARDLTRERERLASERSDDVELRRHFAERLLLFDERAARCRAALPEAPEKPIHNDFNQYNYLFNENMPPVILDWERAISAPREYEVVRCLNQLPLVAPAYARRFLDGYRAVRPLDPARLAWAVDAALTEHAVKQWPVERARRGDPGAAEFLRATIRMVSTLVAGRAQLDQFYR